MFFFFFFYAVKKHKCKNYTLWFYEWLRVVFPSSTVNKMKEERPPVEVFPKHLIYLCQPPRFNSSYPIISHFFLISIQEMIYCLVGSLQLLILKGQLLLISSSRPLPV